MSSVASVTSSGTASANETIGKWEVYEINLTTTNTYSNPYKDVTLSALFEGPNEKEIIIEGFWNGGNAWKVRMTPTEVGTWEYTTTSNDDQLNGKTGTFETTSSDKRGFIKINPEYLYSFMYDDATPYLPVGDNVWTMFTIGGHPFDETGPTGANFKSYVDKRAMQGFNWMHGQLGYWTGPNEGGYSFSASGDVNPVYYQWVDKRVSYATGKGMVVGITFDLDAYMKYGGMSSLEHYSRYIVARYGAYNVAWLIAPEYEDDGGVVGVERWRQIGQLVSASDPYHHPLSLHTTGTTADDFGPDAWMTWVAQQHRGTPESQNSYILADRTYDKPVVNTEPGYEWHANVDNEQTAEKLRKDFWAITMAGGFAIYGHKETFVAPIIPFNPDAMDSPGATYVMHLANFLKRLSWWNMTPDNSLVNNGFCLANPGNEYVIYLPPGGSVTVDLSATTGTLDAEWYDPKDGTYHNKRTVIGGGSVTFTPPFSGDAVLHIVSDGHQQRGDLNGDAQITSADVPIALWMAVRGEYTSEADMNRDGMVTSLDALMILQVATNG